jgi:hypothetical protein
LHRVDGEVVFSVRLLVLPAAPLNHDPGLDAAFENVFQIFDRPLDELRSRVILIMTETYLVDRLQQNVVLPIATAWRYSLCS